MPTTDRLTRDQRIAKERAEMDLRPWEFSPSQVYLFSNPFTGGEVGRKTWAIAQQQRRELLARNPDYFWDDPEGNEEPDLDAAGVPSLNTVFPSLRKPKGKK